jgi:hypothetical protein
MANTSNGFEQETLRAGSTRAIHAEFAEVLTDIFNP